MATEVKVPELGENIETADVVSVLVKPGDQVSADQALIEVESDKAALEIPSPQAGTVGEIKVKAGQKIRVGQVILILADGPGAAAADSSGGQTAAGSDQSARGPSADGAGSTAAAPSAKSEGASASDAASAQSVGASSSASATQTAPAKPASQMPAGSAGTGRTPPDSSPAPDEGEPVPAAPSTRRLARELGVNIRRVSGSGPGGRIGIQDVKDYAKSVIARRMGEPTSGHVGESPTLPDFTQWGSVRREPMSGIRKRTAHKMVQSWINVPHVTQFDEADITELEAYRKSKSREFEKRGVKLTVTAAVVKITALALRKFEKFNASTDMDHDEIIYKDYVNIGVAVDTPRGLLVPVIKNADKKGLLEIATEIGDLAGRARERKVQPDELQGGNLSVTNLGGLGTTFFTPIINFPDSAVLGVGRAKTQPVWQGKDFVPRMIMPLSVSYDHRSIDGADAARFLRWIAEGLEQPFNILL